MGKKSKRKRRTFVPAPRLDEDQELLADDDLGIIEGATAPDDDGDTGGDSGSAATSISVLLGDSICSSASSAAVAAGAEQSGTSLGGGEPVETRSFKPPPPPRRDPGTTCHRTPTCNRPKEANRDTNISWFFTNWGSVPKTGPKRERIDSVLKKSPATIIGLCECDAITDAHLRLPMVDATTYISQSRPQTTATAVAADERFEQRDSVQYLTIRGSEEHSILLGVRAGIGN